jgi:hypothetical protein
MTKVLTFQPNVKMISSPHSRLVNHKDGKHPGVG